MTLEQELELSYFKDAAPINENHGIWLVQDQRSGKFYVRKTLTVFNKDIWSQFLSLALAFFKDFVCARM